MFRLLRIRLENFRAYRDADLSFEDGVTVINGRNGTGKSTLVEEALEWALFNRVKKETTLQSLRSKAAAPDATVIDEVDFEFDDRRYRVRRTLTAKNSTLAELWSLDAPEGTPSLATGTRGVNEYLVTKLFGFGHQVFTTSFIARQKELDAFSELRPEARMQFFARFAGVDALDQAKRRIREDKRAAQGTAEALAGQLPSSGDAEAALKEERRMAKAYAGSLKSLDMSLAKAGEGLAVAREAVRGMEAVQAEHQALRGQTAANRRQALALEAEAMGLRDSVAALRAELAGYVPVDDIDAAIAALERDRDAYATLERHGEALREARLNAKAIAADIEAKRKDAARTEARSASAVPADAPADAGPLREAEADARGRRAAVEAEIARLRDFVGRVEAGDIARCPTCRTDFAGEGGTAALGHVREEIEAAEAELEAAREAEAAARSAREAAEAAAARHQDALRERDTLLRKAEALRNEAEMLVPGLEREEARVREAERHLEGVDTARAAYPTLHATETALESLRAQRQHDAAMRSKAAQLAEREGALAKAEASIAETEAAQADVERRLKALRFDPDRFAALRDAATAAEAERDRLVAERAEAEKALALAERSVASLEADIARTEALKGKVVSFRREAETLTAVESVVLLLRDDLAKRIAPRIAEHASRLLRDVTDGLYQNVMLSDTYQVSIMVDSGDEWPLAQFSGGEQDVVNLCLRLAISRVILEARGLSGSLLVLDEVFGSQDDERQLAIMDALSRLRAHFPQILLITHTEDVKERADHIVTVERTEAGSVVRLEG